MNIFQRTIVGIAGAHAKTLEKCPEEIGQYVSIGLAILFTGILATLSGGYAILKIFDPVPVTQAHSTSAIALASMVGLLWGALIINMDRLIVMTMNKLDSPLAFYSKAAVRVALSILISLVIAKPLEVRLFADRIEAVIDEQDLSKRERDQTRIERMNKLSERTGLATKEQGKQIELEAKLAADVCPTRECTSAKLLLDEATKKRRYFDEERNGQPLINSMVRERKALNANPRSYQILIVDDIERREMLPEIQRKIENFNREINRLGAVRSNLEKSKAAATREYRNAVEAYKSSLETALEAQKIKVAETTADAAEAKEATQQRIEESNEATSVAFTSNLTTQLEALGELTSWKSIKKDSSGTVIESPSNTLWYINLGITLLFIFVETAPVVVKMLTPIGTYDRMRATQKLNKEFELSAATHTAAITAELQSQTDQQIMNERLQADLLIARRDADARVRAHEEGIQE